MLISMLSPGASFRIGAVLETHDYSMVGFMGSYSWYMGNLDPLVSALAQYEVISAPYSLTEIVFGVKPEGQVAETLTGHKPSSSFQRTTAYSEWSAYVGNTVALFTNWDFTRPVYDLPNEHPISHFNVRGKVSNTPSHHSFRVPDEEAKYLQPLVEGDTWYSFDEHGNFDFSTRNQPYSPFGCLAERLPIFEDEVVNGYYDHAWDGNYGRRYSNFYWNLDGHTVTSFGYTVTRWCWEFPNRYVTQVNEVRFTYEVETYKQIPRQPNTVYHITNAADFVVRAQDRIAFFDRQEWQLPPASGYSLLGNVAERWDNGDSSITTYHPTVQCSIASVSLRANRVRELIGYPYAHPDTGDPLHSLRAFRTAVVPRCRDFYPCSFFSSKDAIDTDLVQLGSNHIETLVELRDVLAMVDVVRLVARLRHNPRNIAKLLPRLLDVLAAAKLTYSLGIAPTIDDALEVQSRSRELARRFLHAKNTGMRKAHGKFSVKCPSGYLAGFEDAWVTARSTVWYELDLDTSVAYALAVKSMGLLPSLQYVWDLLPLSFVADWFLHVSDKLGALDTQAQMFVMRVSHCTHSVSCNWKFDPDVSEEYSFVPANSAEGEEPSYWTGYSYYERFITTTVPVLAPTNLPVFGEASIPDWGTFLSLVYLLYK